MGKSGQCHGVVLRISLLLLLWKVCELFASSSAPAAFKDDTTFRTGSPQAVIFTGPSNMNVSSGSAKMVAVEDSCDMPGLPITLSSYEQTLVAGSTVAFWNPDHMRYINMSDAQNVGKSEVNAKGASSVWCGWEGIKFVVVGAGQNIVALWNPIHERFLRMTSRAVDRSAKRADGSLWWNSEFEKFRPVDAGNGSIALWSVRFQKFVRMSDGDTLTVSRACEGATLPVQQCQGVSLSFTSSLVPPL